jgi:uncharacterized membrane protein YvbJ
MKDHACPNCGGAQPQVLAPGEFKCTFCGQLFYNEAMRQQHRKDAQFQQSMQAQLQQQQMVAHTMKAAAGIGKKVLLFVAIFLFLIFGFIAYMATKSMNEAQKMQEEMMEQFHQ